MPRCEMGRKAHDLYEWLDRAARLRRAG